MDSGDTDPYQAEEGEIVDDASSELPDGLSGPPEKRVRFSEPSGDGNDGAECGFSGLLDRQAENGSAIPYNNPLQQSSDMALDDGDLDMDKAGTHEFEIIDEVVMDEDEQDEPGDQDSDESLDDSELYAMLEEGITKDTIANSESDRPIEREKVVLVERGHDPFDILPEGWLVVTHNSGMPVYLHRHSRVCTMGQPYFLGSGSARKHDIPVSAIPCLKYRRALEKECPAASAGCDSQAGAGWSSAEGSAGVAGDKTDFVMSNETDKKDSELSPEVAGTKKASVINPFPSVKIKSAEEMKKETSLDFMQLREYCQKLFEFKTVTVQRYKTWRDRRKHMGSKKQSRPELPSSTKLITCSLPNTNPSTDKKKTKGKEFFLNPSGKSFVCILHEYVQHTMKVQPFYIFKELENSKTPYSATVMINDMEYGTGCAISKKQAKSEAAKETLKILIPEMNSLTDEQLQKNNEDLSFFDEIKIEDPRISELGNKAGQPSPYQILRECLSRNYGMGDTDCLLDMKPLKHQNCEFTITVGKHTATVVAKSKRSGKQRAAQAILQKLHPHVPSWGSLLRLYGNTADRGQSAKKKDVNEVKRHRPNQAILDRLREEMKRLSAQRDAIKSHGRLVVKSEDLPNKVSSVDL